MKKLLTICSLVMVVGCYTMDINMSVKKDGSGKVSFVVTIPYLAPEGGQPDTTLDNMRATLKNMGQGKGGAKLLKYNEKIDTAAGNIVMTADYSFKDFNKFFNGEGDEFSFKLDKNGKDRTITCIFKQDSLMSTELPDNATSEDSASASMGEFVNMFLASAMFNLVLDVEGTVSSHNADSVKAGKIYWSAPFYSETPETKTLTVKYKVK
ncbi:MAG: hypothetical protein ACP5QG_06825 [candidate division WOR-3 bacterium]